MPQYLKEHGERLVELGYRIVPIPPGGKGPKRKGWPQFRADAAQVRQWYTNGSAHDGVGIIAATTPAIDVDILDEKVAGLMADQIDLIFEGQSLLMRTGRAPKFLIPFRSDNPFRKMSSGVYTDGKHEHKVEILGDGQQWVAYHTHPDTGKPYQWWDGVSDTGIHDVPLDQLPVLQRDDAQRVIDAFELLAAGMVASGKWSVKSASVEKREAPDEDPFAEHAEPTDLTKPQIEWLLKKLPLDDREGWLRAGRILHHQFGASEEGFDFWTAISESHEKYNAEDQQRVWDSFGHSSASPETARSLMKEFGQPPKPQQPNSGFVQAAQFASAQKVEWHIKHVLPKRGLIVVYGDPGSSKSFFTLDMVAHVARGLVWRGHRVRQANVAYIAAEGVAGFGNRLAAYSKHHAVSLNELPVFVRGGAFDLKEQFLDISEKINEIGNVGVVVIDTLAAVTAGGNENTSEDMGSAIDAAQRIIESTGASVILIHHSNNQGGVRGWSGLRGAVDNQIRIERKDALRTAHIEKQKEGEDGKAYGYRLQVVHLYDDEDGDPVTSCAIVEDEDVAPNTRGTKKEKKSTGGDFSTSDKYAKARKYLEIIRDAAGLGDANIDETDVITAIQADETVNPLKESDYPRPDNIKRTLLTLGEHGKIKREGRWIRVCE